MPWLWCEMGSKPHVRVLPLPSAAPAVFFSFSFSLFNCDRAYGRSWVPACAVCTRLPWPLLHACAPLECLCQVSVAQTGWLWCGGWCEGVTATTEHQLLHFWKPLFGLGLRKTVWACTSLLLALRVTEALPPPPLPRPPCDPLCDFCAVAPLGSRKPYGCQYCSHRTARLRDLLDHERVHTGEKPYSCPFCPFKSAFASSARVHERRHLSPASSK